MQPLRPPLLLPLRNRRQWWRCGQPTHTCRTRLTGTCKQVMLPLLRSLGACYSVGATLWHALMACGV